MRALVRRLRRWWRGRQVYRNCPKCYGSGYEIQNVDPDGGIYVGACPNCDGTGRLV